MSQEAAFVFRLEFARLRFIFNRSTVHLSIIIWGRSSTTIIDSTVINRNVVSKRTVNISSRALGHDCVTHVNYNCLVDNVGVVARSINVEPFSAFFANRLSNSRTVRRVV